MSHVLRVLVLLVFVASSLVLPREATSVKAQSTGPKLLPAKSFLVAPGQAAKLAYDGATLEIGADAVATSTLISITPLAEQDLPALDQGMANTTTGPRRGYRFLPHGMRFKT